MLATVQKNLPFKLENLITIQSKRHYSSLSSMQRLFEQVSLMCNFFFFFTAMSSEKREPLCAWCSRRKHEPAVAAVSAVESLWMRVVRRPEEGTRHSANGGVLQRTTRLRTRYQPQPLRSRRPLFALRSSFSTTAHNSSLSTTLSMSNLGTLYI